MSTFSLTHTGQQVDDAITKVRDGVVNTFDTTTALITHLQGLAVFPADGTAYKTLGRTAKYDSPEAIFKTRDVAHTDNGGTVHTVTGTKHIEMQNFDGNPKHFGAVGDGVTDDTSAIQAALNSNAKIISGGGYTYKVNGEIQIGSNKTLRDISLDASGLSSQDTCLTAEGTGIVNSTTLTSNANIGEYSVDVTDGSLFSIGDYVLIKSNSTYDYSAATVDIGEIKRVTSVTGNSVAFDQAFYDNYYTANSATLNTLNLVENVTIDNVTILGPNVEGNGNNGFVSNFANEVRVLNCTFKDIDTYCCAIQNTVNFEVSSNYFDGVEFTGVGTIFYAVVLINCAQWGVVSNNRGEQVRHLVTTTSSTSYAGQPYFITVDSNIINNAMAESLAYQSWAYENHGFGKWITWSNNIADSCRTGINIERGDNIITGNYFVNCSVNGIRFSNETNLMEGNTVTNNTITQSTNKASSYMAIEFASAPSQVRKNNLISNNIIQKFGSSDDSDFGVRVRSGSDTSSGCVIENNIFSNNLTQETTDYGVYIEQKSWNVNKNTFINHERAIRIEADGCQINDNHITVESPSTTQSAIFLSSDNNIVKGNSFRGCYRAFANNGSGSMFGGNIELGVTTPNVASASNNYIFKELTAEPSDKVEGMVVFADGSSWNPGSGQGLYAYINGAWSKL